VRPLDARLPEAKETGAAPLVSIVIPVFNQSRFLAEAIASALAQTIDPVEVLVVDDGSTDDSAAVVAQFPSVRLIRQENQGLASARNTGWRAARGRYLVFLDADDRLRPRALAANLDRFASEPDCGFVYGGHQLIDGQGRPIDLPRADDLGLDGYEGLLRGNAVAMHATVMYQRELVEEAGGFDAALPACEDYDLMLRVARRHRVGFSPEIIADYRRQGDNMSDDVPLMLATALRVLRRQRAHVAGQPRRQAAFVEGVRRWKGHYAREALWRLDVAIRHRTLGFAQVFAALRVFAVAPASVLRVAAVEGWRLVSRQRTGCDRPPAGPV
jgi:glycosyltransferase involved in cell wall biosynthesis